MKREEKPTVIRPSFLQLQRGERRLYLYRLNSIQHPLCLQYGECTRCQLYTRQLPLQINALVAQPDGNKKQLFIMSEVITCHWGPLIVLQLETWNMWMEQMLTLQSSSERNIAQIRIITNNNNIYNYELVLWNASPTTGDCGARLHAVSSPWNNIHEILGVSEIMTACYFYANCDISIF